MTDILSDANQATPEDSVMGTRAREEQQAHAPEFNRKNQTRLVHVTILVTSLLSSDLLADDWPAFDRPGILFAPEVLPVGVWSIELGSPDASLTRSGGDRLEETALQGMFRYGLTTDWELQFEFAPYVRERVKTVAGTDTQTGHSDARVGVRSDASASMADWFAADAVALQAGVVLNTGHSNFKGSSNEVDLGIAASWQLPTDGHEVDAMLQWIGTSGESIWFLATTYGFSINDSVSAFAEAGAWFGDENASVAGAGVIWRSSGKFQVDGYLLKRLSGEIADTQFGFGVSWMFF